jgi:enoyl-CoA hydratase/carnithine racemase
MSFQQTGVASRALLARDEAKSPANLAQRVAWIWAECPVPVVAAVHGAAFGGGLQIALGADIRLVAPDAQLSVMEIRYGLVPDMTASRTLLAVVRPDVAKELTFTGRVVGAEEAVRIGLATRVETDPRAAALELARTIAAQSPHAVRAAKRLLDTAPSLSTPDRFLLETELQLSLLGSPNQLEAVTAVMTRRAPTFVDPD